MGVSQLYCSQVSLFIKIGSNGTIHSSILTVSKYFFHFIFVSHGNLMYIKAVKSELSPVEKWIDAIVFCSTSFR